MPDGFHTAIIGAGASGLMAAIAAGRVRPRSVVLLEKEARVGRKLLATGNGRCNLLNASVDPARYHGGGAPGALSLLKRFSPAWAVETFAAIGLVCREEDEGRVYPFSGQSNAVLDTLRAACGRLNVETRCGAAVVRVSRERGGFLLETSDGGRLRAARVIVAAGGAASPVYGADGAAHRLLASLGHAITPVFPALAPLAVPPEGIRGLKGVRVRAALTLLADGNPVRAETGEALFSDVSVSGVAAMQLARAAAESFAAGRHVSLSILLMAPDAARAETSRRAEMLRGEAAEHFFVGLLHPRVAMCLLRVAQIAPDTPVGAETAARLTPLLSDWRLPVVGVAPMAQAQVTAGGARMDQFDPETLESRLVPGLFACGEALDVDGDCGGYNLMWAWASGWAAGAEAAKG